MPAARRINWSNAITVGCAAILIGTQTFVAAIAAGWAVAGILGIGEIGGYVLEVACLIPAAWALVWFVKSASKVEPIFE